MQGDFDGVLRFFQKTDLYWRKNGPVLVNHGTMAADALVELGRGDWVKTLKESYFPGQLSPLKVGEPLNDRDAALGDVSRSADWVATYQRDLRDTDPLELVRKELPTLAPGVMGASLHGLLRTAHAVRAHRRVPTETTALEIAYGLALWASGFMTLPGEPNGNTDPVSALESVVRLDPEKRVAGIISEQVKPVRDQDGFSAAVDELSVDGSLESAVSRITTWAARRMLAEPSARFAYLHAFTSTSSLRLLIPVLGPDDQRTLFGCLLRALMAVHSAYDRVAVFCQTEESASTDGLIESCIQTGNDHAFKFVEAVLREEAITSQPVRVQAAWSLVKALSK